jgi:tubulin-specific chaperone A
MEETDGVFAPLREKITEAVSRLEEHIATAESEQGPEEEINKAKEALATGRAVGQGAV